MHRSAGQCVGGGVHKRIAPLRARSGFMFFKRSDTMLRDGWSRLALDRARWKVV